MSRSADVVKRRDPGHYLGRPCAEVASQLGQRIRGVIYRVVQYRRAQHLVVCGDKLSENRRDRSWMGYIRVTAIAFLILMTPGRDVVGAAEQFDIGVRPDSQDGLAEFHIRF
jgi:hypothetical protein